MVHVYFVLLLTIAPVLLAIRDDFHVVRTDLGDIRGNVLQTLLDKRNFYSFRGIRYAEPPIGELRFKRPVSPRPTTTVQDALDYGNICVQRKAFSIIGNEDCLFLNVFTPALKPESLMPVIFVIHGGAYTSGSGNWLGPELMLDRDVVLVTINYRLGPFGFLSLGNAEYPGNYGLHDQLLALRWVQRNIHQFGGNSSAVTLYGNGAGASSAHLHLLSAKSEEFFQRAIITGGSAFVPWAYNTKGHNREAVHAFAEKQLGTPYHQLYPKRIHKLLQDVDAKLLVRETAVGFYKIGTNFKGAVVEWAPVVEVGDVLTPLILQEPNDMLKAFSTNIDVMFGYSDAVRVFTREAVELVSPEIDHPQLLVVFDRNFSIQLPLAGHNFVEEEYDNIIKLTRQTYFGNTSIHHNLSAFLDLTSDIMFAYGTHYAAKEHSWKSSGKTYYYVFSIETDLSFNRPNQSASNLRGVAHGDELSYLFRMYDQGPADYKYESLNPTSMEAQNIRRMTGIFESFAANGNPSIHGMQSKWLAIEGSQINYVQLLTFGIVDGVDPNKGRFIFWDNIFNRDHTTSSSQIYHFNIICLIPCLCLIINKYYI